MGNFLVRSIFSDSETRKSGPKCLSAQISFHSFPYKSIAYKSVSYDSASYKNGSNKRFSYSTILCTYQLLLFLHSLPSNE